MSAEDRLQEILRDEAQSIVPSGDGLARIQARVARRRQRRLWLVPSAAVATAGVAAAFFLLAPDDRTTQTLVPGTTPSATSARTSEPTPTSSVAPVPADSYTGPAVWPFTSQAEAEAWDPQQMPWAEDGLAVGRRFVKDFLGVSDVTLRQDCLSCEVLAVVAEGKDIATLVLAHYSTGDKHLFTVVSVMGDDLKVTSPKQGADVGSPLNVTGTLTGVDENVGLRLLDADGQQVAQAGAPAGSAVPWSATMTWNDRTWTHGALVARTGTNKDGTTTRLVVVPVTQGSSATSVTGFAGLVDGHVSLFDATTGERTRQLTYPPTGKQDVEATWAAGTVVWTRVTTAATCTSELDRRSPDGTSTIASSTSKVFRTPQLSPSGAWLAYVEQPCTDAAYTVVISGGGAPDRRIAGPSGSVVTVLDVRDDGALLVVTNDRQATGPGTVGLVPAGALSLDGLAPLEPASGCYLASGAAFDGRTPVAFETCGSDVRLVRFSESGALGTPDVTMRSMDAPQSVSVRNGDVLVELFGGDSYGAIARYANGRFTTVIANTGCSSTSDLKGCVRAPDW